MNLKKDLAIVGGLFLIVAGLLVFGREFTSIGTFGPTPRESTTGAQLQNVPRREDDKINLTAGNFSVLVEIADTKDERQKGLSKKDQLPIAEGMLFVFEKNDTYGIWMKDMKLPIDIIWIDNNKKIVDIVQNALPEPGKDDEELKIYRPQSESLYILEINAWLAALNNLQVGDQVNFELYSP